MYEIINAVKHNNLNFKTSDFILYTSLCYFICTYVCARGELSKKKSNDENLLNYSRRHIAAFIYNDNKFLYD